MQLQMSGPKKWAHLFKDTDTSEETTSTHTFGLSLVCQSDTECNSTLEDQTYGLKLLPRHLYQEDTDLVNLLPVHEDEQPGAPPQRNPWVHPHEKPKVLCRVPPPPPPPPRKDSSESEAPVPKPPPPPPPVRQRVPLTDHAAPFVPSGGRLALPGLSAPPGLNPMEAPAVKVEKPVARTPLNIKARAFIPGSASSEEASGIPDEVAQSEH
mmetsp:Transcript_97178/g.173119  ORF Transcript_97178/g.173119 Transcript_97178/m.173119 type:complete len:210 (-) Transcript_97178:131-760(-)|eukprot:CAMPEP_0197659500 /NCGR_PEP_ID=MMETSP1338-20131121/47923_1 /TAXON_ID=43686 ORGANISM="Pelagodinium beii, Strain RCC1491" /NCGR_SAMPLE_ID=MMETSP1338 /ASSEMBLY_ACC=CAM_ASM_000754 /LENGTH=209 /DNA_ID=CAMNT_0043236445 /DNA_START=80 /DNA_END=709 /DNA_ORIENTATION=-